MRPRRLRRDLARVGRAMVAPVGAVARYYSGITWFKGDDPNNPKLSPIRQLELEDWRGDPPDLILRRGYDGGESGNPTDYLKGGQRIAKIDAVSGRRDGSGRPYYGGNDDNGSVANIAFWNAVDNTNKARAGGWVDLSTADPDIDGCDPAPGLRVDHKRRTWLVGGDPRRAFHERQRGYWKVLDDGHIGWHAPDHRLLWSSRGGGGTTTPTGTRIWIAEDRMGPRKDNPSCWLPNAAGVKDGSEIWASPPASLTGGREYDGRWRKDSGGWLWVGAATRPGGCA